MTAVITGANGFSAHFLAQYIRIMQPGSILIGIDVHPGSKNRFLDRYFSLEGFSTFSRAVVEIKDQMRFFHLGGLLGTLSLSELVEANVSWTARFLELAAQVSTLESFVNVGSSAEYGRQKAHLLTEDLTPHPVTAYGISKHLQTQLVLSFARVRGIPAVCTRTFNLVGPGLSDKFVVGRILAELLRVKRAGSGAVEMGRLDSKRDFIDVRDAVKIYWLLAADGRGKGLCNVASGRTYQIQEVFDHTCNLLGIVPEVRQVRDHNANQDLDAQYADVAKLRGLVALPPLIDLEQSLSDMIGTQHEGES